MFCKKGKKYIDSFLCFCCDIFLFFFVLFLLLFFFGLKMF